jgi:nucleotide-binding universal stress UspA family protein
MIQTILLATDGSPCAERALQYAASIGKVYQSRIVIVHAFISGSGSQLQNSISAIYETGFEAEQLVGRSVTRLNQMGILTVTTDVVEGPAVNVIIGAAESHSADILILGARGQSLWAGDHLGSVSMAIVQRVGCPVLVVR